MSVQGDALAPKTHGTIDHLLAIEAVKQVKARYFRELDTKNWQGLGEVFSADAVFDLRGVNSVQNPISGKLVPPEGGVAQIFHGRLAIVAMIRAAVADLITVHQGHTSEVEVLSATTARAIVPMEDVLRHPSGSLLLHGFGHYHETYEKALGRWLIKTSRITRLYLEGSPLSIPETPDA